MLNVFVSFFNPESSLAYENEQKIIHFWGPTGLKVLRNKPVVSTELRRCLKTSCEKKTGTVQTKKTLVPFQKPSENAASSVWWIQANHENFHYF